MKWVLSILTGVLVVSVMVFQVLTPDVRLAEKARIEFVDMPGWERLPLEASEAERKGLPADTYIEKYRYQHDDGAWFVLSLVVSARHKLSIHRPELCLPAQGFQMTNPRAASVGGRDWRFITVETKGGERCGFAYTFANQEGFKTASHVRRVWRDVWDRSVLGRIDRWAMITVFSSSADEKTLRFVAEHVERMFKTEGANDD